MFDFTRHFLSSVTRILGLEHNQMTGGFLAVEYAGRTVQVRVSHIGVSPQEWIRSPTDTVKAMPCSEQIKALMETCQSATVMTSIMNGYDRLKGAQFQLLAFERLLDECRQWRGVAKMVLLCPKPPKREFILVDYENAVEQVTLESRKAASAERKAASDDVTEFLDDQWEVSQSRCILSHTMAPLISRS